MSGCVFCSIVKGEIPAQVVWRDEHAMAFRDIRPQAPTHIVFISCKHIEAFEDLGEEDVDFLKSYARGVREVVRLENIHDGYRIISNNGRDAGQEVPHLHLHLLAGMNLGSMIAISNIDR